MNNKSPHLDIYNMMFDVPNYNTHPDNEFRFQIVIDFLNKNKIDSMIDIGSGRGNLIKMVMNNYPNIDVFSTDLNKYHNVSVPFYEINLCDSNWDLPELKNKFNLLSCLDVIEHLNKDCIDYTFNKFSSICDYAIITIANHSDIQKGIELHTIQEDEFYWNPILEKYFEIIEFQKFYGDRLNVYKLKSKF